MTNPIKLFDIVALLKSHPEKGLGRGRVGTIVESWAPGVWEVEFSDTKGQTCAFLAVPEEELIRLDYEPSADVHPAGTYAGA